MNDMLAYYILSNMKVANNISSKEISEANEALETAKKALMERKKNLTDKELEMIDIGLDVAMFESQLPDFMDDDYEDILKLKSKLGILKKKDMVCPKCKNRDLDFALHADFGGSHGLFTCKKCGYSFIDEYNLATQEDWDDFRERMKGVMW